MPSEDYEDAKGWPGKEEMKISRMIILEEVTLEFAARQEENKGNEESIEDREK